MTIKRHRFKEELLTYRSTKQRRKLQSNKYCHCLPIHTACEKDVYCDDARKNYYDCCNNFFEHYLLFWLFFSFPRYNMSSVGKRWTEVTFPLIPLLFPLFASLVLFNTECQQCPTITVLIFHWVTIFNACIWFLYFCFCKYSGHPLLCNHSGHCLYDNNNRMITLTEGDDNFPSCLLQYSVLYIIQTNILYTK